MSLHFCHVPSKNITPADHEALLRQIPVRQSTKYLTSPLQDYRLHQTPGKPEKLSHPRGTLDLSTWALGTAKNIR